MEGKRNMHYLFEIEERVGPVTELKKVEIYINLMTKQMQMNCISVTA